MAGYPVEHFSLVITFGGSRDGDTPHKIAEPNLQPPLQRGAKHLVLDPAARFQDFCLLPLVQQKLIRSAGDSIHYSELYSIHTQPSGKVDRGLQFVVVEIHDDIIEHDIGRPPILEADHVTYGVN